jgi:hypothetical protein
MMFPRGLSTRASVRRQLLKHSGRGGGAYAYFDSEAGLGSIAEAIMLPRELPEPEYRFPPAH